MDEVGITYDDKISIARQYYIEKGYRVHSGLQFGTSLVLYADDPNLVHSDFCVYVVRPDERIDWMTMQTLVRSMPDLHKTLILVNVKKTRVPSSEISCTDEVSNYKVEEVAITSEHAPFRHREVLKDIGAQRKRKLSY